MITITLHRNSYPTLLSMEVTSLLRAFDRGRFLPSDYKARLRERFTCNGRGPGYSSGLEYTERPEYAHNGLQRHLVETFNSEIGAFVLRRV